MTIHEAVDVLSEIEIVIDAYHKDEIKYLRDGEAEHVHDCRIRIATAEYLRGRILERAAA